jgi:hypothetical protein
MKTAEQKKQPRSKRKEISNVANVEINLSVIDGEYHLIIDGANLPENEADLFVQILLPLRIGFADLEKELKRREWIVR